jgi:hemoglobin
VQRSRRYDGDRLARDVDAGLRLVMAGSCQLVIWPRKSEPPTLYEWTGGRRAIARLIDCFYDRVERDELLSRFFPGGVSAEHWEHVTTSWCEVFGGPAVYTERLGGYPAMLAHHHNLAITAEQRFQFA